MANIKLLGENDRPYSENADFFQREFIKSLTKEEIAEDAKWWHTALAITGNQQNTFTVGQIVGNLVAKTWDEIPALKRIKQWHSKATNPQAAAMIEMGYVAEYFMASHPVFEFKYIDSNGGKKGNTKRYLMQIPSQELTLGSDVDWTHKKRCKWSLGNLANGEASTFRELFTQVAQTLHQMQRRQLHGIMYGIVGEGCHTVDIQLDYNIVKDSNGTPTIIWGEYNDLEFSHVPYNHRGIDNYSDNMWIEVEPGWIYIWGLYSNNAIIKKMQRLFDIFGLSYEDLKITLL